MPLQTAYTARILPAYEGMVADSREHEIESRIVETAAGIGFGKVVVVGTSDQQVRISEASRAFVGISEATHQSELGGLSDLYPQYANIPIMRYGMIWVLASVAVAPGQPAYFVPATGVLTNVTSGNTLIPGGTFESSTSGSGLAKLRIAG